MSQRTRIKICGITRPEDAVAIAESGADSIGLNFSDQSARQIDVRSAEEISDLVEGRLIRLGVFVDPDADDVLRVLDRVALDMLQFHGAETAEFCASFSLPYAKVHRVADSLDVDALAADYPDACCHLLDTFTPGQAGGTGQTFDWSLWPRSTTLKLILAGGLTAENVAAAIRTTQPYGVDVAGGVEGQIKGVKEADRIRKFVAAVRQADS